MTVVVRIPMLMGNRLSAIVHDFSDFFADLFFFVPFFEELVLILA